MARWFSALTLKWMENSMSGMFIDSKQLEIVIEYVETPNGIIILDDDEKKKKHTTDVKKITTKWKKETWKLSNAMTRDAIIFNYATGAPAIDVTKMSEFRLYKLLVSWDIKDESGEPVPCDEESKDMLSPELGTALLQAYNKATQMTEEQVGN